ncbi:MAG: hypothetical protein Q7R96_00495 [Nanoarchaeota archaeon]|nr:hypothetical protein [Nanoarchaeota archaeon]
MGEVSTSYRHTPQVDPEKDRLKARVQAMTTEKDIEKRRKIFTQIANYAEVAGTDLIGLFHEHSSTEKEKGLENIEIEMKLEDVKLTGTVKTTLETYTFPELILPRGHYSQGKITASSSINHYFGTPQEERAVYMRHGRGTDLKIKGQNIPWEGKSIPEKAKYVLRRKETLTTRVGYDLYGSSPLIAIVEEILAFAQPTPVTYIGSFTKEKATTFLLNQETGRIYSVVLGTCNRVDRKEQLITSGSGKRNQLTQIEVEYAGCIPGLTEEKDVELRIIRDILDIATQLQEYHHLYATTRTKFEWLQQSREELKKTTTL